MKIAIGADHGGVELKRALVAAMRAQGHDVTDHGTDGTASVDYPDFAASVTAAVQAGADFGVLVCGSGIGMCMAANRVPGIRAAVLHNEVVLAAFRTIATQTGFVASAGHARGPGRSHP